MGSSSQLDMSRKFLFCFPLVLGNIIFGYVLIIISIAVFAYNLYRLGLCLVSDKNEIDEKFQDFENVDSIFGQNKTELVALIVLLYYSTYIVVAFLLFLFASLFTCGAYRANSFLVSTFYGYCFVHLFLTIILVIWEAVTSSWLELGLVLLFDVLLLVCMCSVKYLNQAIHSGCLYSKEVYYNYRRHYR